jgi:hypothetical protein
LWGVCLVFSERLPRVVVVATFLAIVLNPTLAAWNQTEDFKTTLDANYLPVARVGEVSVYQARPAASGGASPDHR